MVQLVESAVINERVFRRGGGIAEAVAEVPAERRAVQKPGRARPVPHVVIRPDAASPVEDGKKFVRHQLEPLCTKLHPAGRAQAVDLLVVVKMPGLFKRRCNHEALVRLIREGNDALDGVFAAEPVHVKRQPARAVFVIERQRISGRGNFARTQHRRLRQPRLSHRKRAHGAFGNLPSLVEVQKRDRIQSHVAVVGNREGNADVPVSHKIVVPLLDARFRRADLGPAVDWQQASCPAGLAQIAARVEKRRGARDFMLHHGVSSFVVGV